MSTINLIENNVKDFMKTLNDNSLCSFSPEYKLCNKYKKKMWSLYSSIVLDILKTYLTLMVNSDESIYLIYHNVMQIRNIYFDIYFKTNEIELINNSIRIIGTILSTDNVKNFDQ